MLLVPKATLRPGMTLAMPVFHPACEDLVLLNASYTLDRKVIHRLDDFDVTHCWIRFPDLEELEGRANEGINRGHISLYQALSGSVDELERRVEVKVNLYKYKKAVRHMLTEIVADPEHEIITHQLADCGPLLSGHLANTCYLSLLIGAHLSGYLRSQRSTLPSDVAENTGQLGLGALLHDISKLNMPDEMQNKSILSPEAAMPEYQMHVRASYEEVREHASLTAAQIALNHHQRFDGSGFPELEHRDDRPPQTQRGNGIHIFNRIVAVVDTFDHLLCPDGHYVPTIVALCAIKSERFAGWFDPVVVETLLRLVPVFMIGSLVTLSDGTEAVIVANHPEAPCKPSVKLLNGPICEANTRVRGRQLDLRMCPHLEIAVVDGFDVRPYLFTGELEPVLT